MSDNSKIANTYVRDVQMKLLASNRSLNLCARMNYETENLDFIDSIPQGSTLYDLGACEGRFSVYAGLRGIKVLSFEPEALNFEALKTNKELNSLTDDQVRVFNFGVSEKSKIGTIQIGQPWAGGHQKVVKHSGIERKDLNFDFAEEQNIELISLDEFLEGEYLFPEYLKIDIDGSELPFIKGAKNTLQDSRLKAIIFELNKSDDHFEEIINTLSQSGLDPSSEHGVPNEPDLYNIIFQRQP